MEFKNEIVSSENYLKQHGCKIAEIPYRKKRHGVGPLVHINTANVYFNRLCTAIIDNAKYVVIYYLETEKKLAFEFSNKKKPGANLISYSGKGSSAFSAWKILHALEKKHELKGQQFIPIIIPVSKPNFNIIEIKLDHPFMKK